MIIDSGKLIAKAILHDETMQQLNAKKARILLVHTMSLVIEDGQVVKGWCDTTEQHRKRSLESVNKNIEQRFLEIVNDPTIWNNMEARQ